MHFLRGYIAGWCTECTKGSLSKRRHPYIATSMGLKAIFTQCQQRNINQRLSPSVPPPINAAKNVGNVAEAVDNVADAVGTVAENVRNVAENVGKVAGDVENVAENVDGRRRECWECCR